MDSFSEIKDFGEIIIESAKLKSTKGVVLEYKGRIIDPKKVNAAVKKFSYSALGALVVTSSIISVKHLNDKIVEYRQEPSIEFVKNDPIDYAAGKIVSNEGIVDVSKMKIDEYVNSEVARTADHQNFMIDYIDIVHKINPDGSNLDEVVLSFYNKFGYSKAYVKEFLETLDFHPICAGKNYQSIEDFVADRGFDSIDEWTSSVHQDYLQERDDLVSRGIGVGR